ncbi:MAG: PQQ-binding-like beta-propeller repeat protein [Planctomycetia bacterium]|nr:PQQ-binding-like beta-propeller repeat protein [Planctomycetia bacterium]
MIPTSVFADDWCGTVTGAEKEPLAGVCVSDGLNVTKTDVNGAFRLKIREEARFLFVSTPAGFRVKGEFYQRIMPQQMEYHFVLEPWAASAGKTVRFIQISDVEQQEGELSWLETIQKYLRENPCAFLISTGDICYRKGLEFNAKHVSQEALGVPVYHTVGNHDLVSGKYGEECYESLFGPSWYSFNAGTVHFVVTPMPGGDRRPSYTTDQIIQWMKNDLAQLKPDTPVIMFQHTTPTKRLSVPETYFYGNLDLKKINLKAWLFGHYHTSIFYTDPESGITFGSVAPPNKGGIDHSPASFYVYTADSAGIQTIETRNSFWSGQAFPAPISVFQEATCLTHLWSANAGANIFFGEPISCETGVIVATADDGNRANCAVISFDEKGGVRWKTSVSNSVKCALAADAHRVYAVDQAGSVYSLDIHTGKILWRDDPGAQPVSMMVAPVVKDGVLYAGQGKTLTAYDTQTGQYLWRNLSRDDGEGTTARLRMMGDILLASSNWRALYAYDAKTGKLLWRAAHDHLRFRSSAPVPFKDKDGKDCILVSNNKACQTVNLQNGSLIQSVTAAQNLQTASSPLVFENLILVGSADFGLCAYDAQTLEFLWNVKTEKNLIYTVPYVVPVQASVEATPMRVGKNVIFGALDGNLYVVAPSRQEGKILQKIALGAPVLSAVSLSEDGNVLYVSDFGGNVHAFLVNSDPQ